MIDVLFTSHNRKEFAAASFAALYANTDWALVNRLFVIDDDSTDGTKEMLREAVGTIPCASTFTSARFGGSVAPLNYMLDQSDADLVAKIDSDVIVCLGWLEAMLSVMTTNPDLDALGMEPGFGAPVAPIDVPRAAESAPWIGGVFLARRRAFRQRPRQNDRFFGLTSMWRRRQTAWITPALPCFLLDLLPFEPWMSLAERYIAEGWQRPLHRKPGRYDPSMSDYWTWWSRVQLHEVEAF